MTKEQQNVITFMKTFGQLSAGQMYPSMPNFETRELRARLILEEMIETIKALGFDIDMAADGSLFVVEGFEPNLVEIADGCADSHYVLHGTANACGIDMEPILTEIHNSNMTKMWTFQEIEQGKKDYPGCVIEDYGGGLVRLKHNSKVIKSPHYKRPDVAALLSYQGAIDI